MVFLKIVAEKLSHFLESNTLLPPSQSKGSACVWMVRSVCRLMWFRGVPQGTVLQLLLFILYTSGLFSIVENYMVRYADDSTIYQLFLDRFRILK